MRMSLMKTDLDDSSHARCGPLMGFGDHGGSGGGVGSPLERKSSWMTPESRAAAMGKRSGPERALHGQRGGEGGRISGFARGEASCVFFFAVVCVWVWVIQFVMNPTLLTRDFALNSRPPAVAGKSSSPDDEIRRPIRVLLYSNIVVDGGKMESRHFPERQNKRRCREMLRRLQPVPS